MDIDALIGCLAWHVNSLVNLFVLADMHRISEVHFKIEGSYTNQETIHFMMLLYNPLATY